MTTAGRPRALRTASSRSSTDSTRGWRTSSNSWSGNCASSAWTSRAAVSPVESETMCSSTGGCSDTAAFSRITSTAMATDTVTMDKIFSLARRRGFVFPSSEIYGGLGSAYDYGHYGVLAKNNVKARWLEAMVQERDDIVALDSAIILNPAVWDASGHTAGFPDPLVDSRPCKLRSRADKLEGEQCGRKPSLHPGEFSEGALTEP